MGHRRGAGRWLLVLLLALTLTGCRSDPPAERRPAGGSCVAAVATGGPAPASPAGCRTVRVDFPDRALVPQGLALAPDGTAYVSGYHYRPVPGERACGVVHIDRATGEVLAHAEVLYGDVPGAGRTYCRHGGGVALDRHGLWVAGSTRLWLLDPAALGGPDPVLRVWRVEGAQKASTLATDATGVALGVYRAEHRGLLLHYPYDALLAAGADAVAPGSGPGVVASDSRRLAPSRLQGLAAGPGGWWLTRSSTTCGELVRPSGRRIAFLPGAEGLAFDDDGALWALSESGSDPYQRLGGRPDVPTLTRVEPDALPTAPGGCW